MNYLYSSGLIALILYLAYVMINRAKADKVLADLKRKDRSEELKAIAKAEQELKNAQIRYSNSRREYDHITGEGADSALFDDKD